jgi:phosphomevalonate kinase
MSLDAHLASVVHSNAALVEHKTANVDGISLFYPLLASRYRLIAPDFPGFGHSDAPSPGAGNATAAVAAAGRYGRLLDQLGVAAQAPIVTDVFKRAADLAKELGGAAKPSGAGGGDIGVAMFATPETARLFARALLDDAGPEKSGLFHA